MKKYIFVGSLILSSISMAAAVSTLAPIDNIYVPKGFDNNDSVEIMVSGFFPNLCYKRNTVNVEVLKDVIKVNVTALVDAEDFGICSEMVVPYLETVSLGNLQAGSYKIVVNEEAQNSLTDEIAIQEANSNAIDDNTYAAIKDVRRVGEGNKFIFTGEEYSNCYKFDHFEFIDNGKDVISVLPIMTKVNKYCLVQGKATQYKARIDFTNMKTDRPLLHIRTLDGKSINSVVNLRALKK
ncbi:MAG: hypothetical protein ACOYL6_15855 [Bacteriovoracaceae bacterium]